MFFEIEFMDGVKRVIDTRSVMQWHYGTDTNRIVHDGSGCSMEYFISSLSQGKAIVLRDWKKYISEDEEAINTVNIRTIKPVNREVSK